MSLRPYLRFARTFASPACRFARTAIGALVGGFSRPLEMPDDLFALPALHPYLNYRPPVASPVLALDALVDGFVGEARAHRAV